MIARIGSALEEGILSLLLVLMTLLVFIEVVLRFGFDTGFIWAQELTLHISAWFVLLGASYGVKIGAHIGVDAVVKLMPSKVRRIVSLIAVAGTLVYCGLLFQGSWVYLAKMYQIGIEMEDLPIPTWLAHSALLIGIGLLAFRLIQLGWGIVQGKADGFHFADEAKESMHIAEAAKEKQGDL